MGVSSEFQNSIEKSKTAVKQYFAQRDVYPGELPGIMRKHIYTGAMGSSFFTLMGGLFFLYYGNEVGLTRPLWGLMGGISAFALTSQILSAYITERIRRRKILWFVTALTGRVLRLSVIFLCLWLWYRQWPYTVYLLIAGMCTSDFFDAMAGPPWLSWLADIIPAEQQGRFWGRRSAWVSLAMVCVLIPAGLVMDEVGSRYKMAIVISVFIGAGVIGVVDILIHGTLPEPQLDAPQPEPFWRRVAEPLVDRGFRPWLIFNMAWTASMTLGGALGTLYFLKELEYEKHFLEGIIILSVLSQVGSIMSSSWSGKLVDRLGPKRVLMWGHFFWAILPIYWVFATPATANLWLGWSSFSGGAGSSAASTAANKLITRLPQPQDRAMYVAVNACLANVASGIGVWTAGLVLAIFGEAHWAILGWTFGAFQLLFVASFLLRLTCAQTLLRRVVNPASEEEAEPEAAAA